MPFLSQFPFGLFFDDFPIPANKNCFHIKKIQNWVHLPYALVFGKIPLKAIRVLTTFRGNMQYLPGQNISLMGLGSVEYQNEAI